MQTTIHPISGEELMAYFDGELPPARAMAVHEHLETCRECRNVAADLDAVSRQLSEWQVEAIRPELKLPEHIKRRRP